MYIHDFFQNFLKTFLVGLHGDFTSSVIAQDMSGVPSTVWTDVSMDFMEGLPKVGGKSVIMTVVDRFSKSAHFIPLGHPYSAETVARAFFGDIVRLHGVSASIVSDRDPVSRRRSGKLCLASRAPSFI